MHAASLERSERLQRTLAALSAGEWRSTREVMLRADVCALSSCVAELRANGVRIEHRTATDWRGRTIHEYRLASPEQARLAL